MKKGGELINAVSFIVFIICMISSLFILYNNKNINYNLLFLFPISFACIYFSFFRKKIIDGASPFYIAFCVLLFLRYVIMSLLVTITGYSCDSKANISTDSYFIAQLLMLFEIISINVLLIVSNNNKKIESYDNKESKIKISEKNDFLIILISIIFIVISLNFGNVRHAIYFIFPNSDTSLRFDMLTEIEKAMLIMFSISKQFLILFFIKKLLIKYNKTSSNLYFILALLMAIINILIFTSTNRAEFVIISISSLYLLALLFKKNIKVLLAFSILFILVVVPTITSFRLSNSLVSNNMTLNDISKEFNAYLSGIDNVAISVESAKIFGSTSTFSHLFNDLARSTLGLNFIMKNFNIPLTNSYFNYVWFGYSRVSSQIIPMAGQGYFHLGILGFWIYELFFLYLAIYLEKKNYSANNIYSKYFTLVILFRFAMLQGLNGTILMNELSFDYFIPLCIIFLNNRIYLKDHNLKIVLKKH